MAIKTYYEKEKEIKSRLPNNYKPHNKTLIFDIETFSKFSLSNNQQAYINSAQMKYIGFYSYATEKYYFLTYKDRDKIMKLFNYHDVLVGHNISGFDLPILKNKKNNFNDAVDFKSIVDTLKVSQRKLNYMKDIEGKQIISNHFSLVATHRAMFLEDGKILDFDYNLLKKELNELSEEEFNSIKEYTLADIETNKRIFEEFCNQYQHLKEFMDEKNQYQYKWLVKNYGSYAYHVLCKLLDWEEDYEDNVEQPPYPGAHVFEPEKEKMVGKVRVVDFASQYPHNYFQFNLFTPCSNCKCGEECENRFNGNEIYKIKNSYCIKEIGKVEKIIKDLYYLRKDFKKEGDAREAAIKLVINSIYGISAKPIFKNVYYPNRAADCCSLGRQQIQYARYFFIKKGYDFAYGDTDSVIINNPYTDEQLKDDINEFIKFLKKYTPFPSESFTMDIDVKAKAGFFFQKKKYLLLKEDDSLVIKNLMKENTSNLTKKIFYDYIVPKIKKEYDCKFTKQQILKFIYNEIDKDINIVATHFNIRDSYDTRSSLQSQIKEKYGSGEHWLIKNKKLGAGVAVKYCSLEEAKDLNIYDIDITTVLRELTYFIKSDQTSLNDFKPKIKMGFRNMEVT